MLSRLIPVDRVSLIIASVRRCFGVFGTALGFAAARFRGLTEHLVLALADFQADPAISHHVAGGAGLLRLLHGAARLSHGLYGWNADAHRPRLSGFGRAQAMRAWSNLGATRRGVYLRHIMPNVASTLIVSMTLTFPEIILWKAVVIPSVSGVQPPETSLGNMVGFGARISDPRSLDHLAPVPYIMLTTFPSRLSATGFATSSIPPCVKDQSHDQNHRSAAPRISGRKISDGFRNALRLGVDAIEFDVHLTDFRRAGRHPRRHAGQDGTRDRAGRRMTPGGALATPLRDTDESIPTLSDVLGIFAARDGLHLHVEIKSDETGTPYPRIGRPSS